MFVFDTSPTLQLALVATETLGSPQYLPLDKAHYPRRQVDPVYLRQLHAVANGIAVGLTVMPRMPFSRISGKHQGPSRGSAEIRVKMPHRTQIVLFGAIS